MTNALRTASFSWWILLLAVAGFVLVLLGTYPFGVGRSADSLAYLSCAESLTAGRGFVVWDGRPYIDWPPLYPTLLAMLHELGLDFLGAIRWLNGFTFGAIVVVSALLFRRGFARRASLPVFCGAVVFSYPLLAVHVMAWSEPLFVLLVVAELWAVLRYLERPSWGRLGLAAVLSALAAQQRLAGFALVVATAVVLILWSSREPWWRRARDAVLYAVCALAPLTVWTARNYLIQGTLAGHRTLRLVPPFASLWQIVDSLSSWLVPHVIPFFLRALLVAGLIALVVRLSMQPAEGDEAEPPGRRHVWMVMLVWITAYCLFMISVSLVTTTRTEPLEARLLSPIFIPFMFVIVRSVERVALLPRVASRFSGLWKRALVIGACLWLLYPIALTAKHIHVWRETGASPYNGPRWTSSETLQWLAQHVPPGPLLSNHPEAILCRLERTAALSPGVGETAFRLQERLRDNPTLYLVWFDGVSPFRPILSVDKLKEGLSVELFQAFPDGAVYRLSAAQPRMAP